jgi:hypothetical protein
LIGRGVGWGPFDAALRGAVHCETRLPRAGRAAFL